MDNITHALVGVLLGEATARTMTRRARASSAGTLRPVAIALGVVAAELPDADLVYSGELLGMGQLAYPLHHRGHTHTVLFALVSAVVLWGLARWWRREARDPVASTPLLMLAVAGTLSHIVLDWTNNYGVHPFWPVDARWFYGDAIFIVEPWLWIVSLAPLFWLAHGRWSRALCVVLTLAILAAAWLVGMVPASTATALTVGAIVWYGATARRSHGARLAMAAAGWLLVEGLFFTVTQRARFLVTREVGPVLVDAVTTPGPADPLCVRALVALREADRYVVASAVVAPFPQLRAPAQCGGAARAPLTGTPATRPGSRHVAWETQWTAPLAELRALATSNCHVAAALQYVRIPQWRALPGGGVEFFDARYGEGSFASVTAPPAGTVSCPRFVPGWTPPRQALLATD